MPLEVNQIPAKILACRPKEMIEAHIVERRGRGETRNVSTILRGSAIGPDDHGHRVPANIGSDAILDGGIPWKARLHMGRNCIDVGGVGRVGEIGTRSSSMINQILNQEVSSFNAFTSDDGGEGVKPLASFFWIGIVLQLEVLIHAADCTLSV